MVYYWMGVIVHLSTKWKGLNQMKWVDLKDTIEANVISHMLNT